MANGFTRVPRSALLSVRESFRRVGGGTVLLDGLPNGMWKITLQNPDRTNALSGRMMAALADVADAAEAERPRGLVLCGSRESRHFCAGADFGSLSAIAPSPSGGAAMCALMTDSLWRLQRASPVAVVLHGRAVGGGAELSTLGSFRVLERGASVRFVQATLGVTTGWGGTGRLVALLGPARARSALQEARLLGTVDLGPTATETAAGAGVEEACRLLALEARHIPAPGGADDMLDAASAFFRSEGERGREEAQFVPGPNSAAGGAAAAAARWIAQLEHVITTDACGRAPAAAAGVVVDAWEALRSEGAAAQAAVEGAAFRALWQGPLHRAALAGRLAAQGGAE